MKNKKENLKEVFDFMKQNGGGQTLGDIAKVRRGEVSKKGMKNRPSGICYVCKKFADGAIVHESPGTAKCCIGCDAYQGEKFEV